jgi:hypothetical protein
MSETNQELDTGNTEIKMDREDRDVQERAEKTRAALEAINNDDWLYIPKAVEERFKNQGYVLAWIRISLKGNTDYQSIGLKQREGWEFVQESEAQEMALGFRVASEGSLEGAIIRGDVALAKRPVEIQEAVNKQIKNRSSQMEEAINRRLMENSDSRAPIFNSSKSKVSKGRNAAFDS